MRLSRVFVVEKFEETNSRQQSNLKQLECDGSSMMVVTSVFLRCLRIDFQDLVYRIVQL